MATDTPQSAPKDATFGGSSEVTAATAYRVTLPEFEGPLDLLLHLCQTHELDILNISISFIASKYIEYLELMEGMSVEIAAEYLVMAAHLAYLKSRELVPAPEPLESTEEGEEPLDPREELIRRLLEYQKYKHAAESLGNRPIEGRNVFLRGVPREEAGEAGLAEHSVWKLLEHWAGILKAAKPELTHDVVMDRVSITDRINQIVDLLESGQGMVQFEDLLGKDLPDNELRHKIVVTLLAVLELARLRVVRVMHDEATSTFFLSQVAGAGLDEARRLKVTSVKVAEEEEEPSPDDPSAQLSGPADALRMTDDDGTGVPAVHVDPHAASVSSDEEGPPDLEIPLDVAIPDLLSEELAAEVAASFSSEPATVEELSSMTHDLEDLQADLPDPDPQESASSEGETSVSSEAHESATLAGAKDPTTDALPAEEGARDDSFGDAESSPYAEGEGLSAEPVVEAEPMVETEPVVEGGAGDVSESMPDLVLEPTEDAVPGVLEESYEQPTEDEVASAPSPTLEDGGAPLEAASSTLAEPGEQTTDVETQEEKEPSA